MASVLLALALAATSRSTKIDPVKASIYFQQFELLSKAEGGNLWGKTFYGRFMFVDPDTKEVVANQEDPRHQLTREGDVFVGKLPPDTGVANTTIAWGGATWATAVWPVPTDYVDRMSLMVHESFHRLQPDLGFTGEEEPCGHLETLKGRYWMQLEWRALAQALRAPKETRNGPIRDALLFRQMRYQADAEAERKEGELERLEGLAEYSGIKLRGTSDAESMEYQAKRLDSAVLHTANMTRGFAYLTGPAYGLLLDATGVDWRPDATKPTNFLEMLSEAAKVDLAAAPEKSADTSALKYDGGPILIAEQKREEEFRARAAAYRKLLIAGPVLALPMAGWNASFNPQNIVQLGTDGTVYPALTLTADWGILKVEKAALIAPRWSMTYVALPFKTSGSDLVGDGWKITLKPGWKTAPGDRKGDLKLVKG